MIKKILIIKMYWNRAMSHFGIPLSIITHGVAIATLLKVFNVENEKIILYTLEIIILLSIIIILLGYLDVKYKVYEQENTLNNKHNKELKKLLQNKINR